MTTVIETPRLATLRQAVQETRYAYLTSAAVRAASRVGFHALTRDAIADEAGISAPLVSKYLGDMDAVRDMIMERAVAEEILDLIAQGLTLQHPAALEAPAELRARAAHVIAY